MLCAGGPAGKHRAGTWPPISASDEAVEAMTLNYREKPQTGVVREVGGAAHWGGQAGRRRLHR
jgi:hypothetical protein